MEYIKRLLALVLFLLWLPVVCASLMASLALFPLIPIVYIIRGSTVDAFDFAISPFTFIAGTVPIWAEDKLGLA